MSDSRPIFRWLHWSCRADVVPFVAEPDRILLRRWVLTTPLGTVRIHHLCAPDVALYHDHPWAFLSIVFWGWYVEEFPSGEYLLRRAASWAWRSERTLHRVSAVSSGGCWTLVFTGPKRKTWGFLTASRWAAWRSIVHPSIAQDIDARHGRGQ